MISDVIGWKFNHQPGMRCKEIDGVLTIIDFPGGIPSQADQDTWTAEYLSIGIDEEKTARAIELDQPKKAFAALIEQLWDNSAELQAAFSTPGAMKQDAISRYKAKINGG